MRYFTFKKCLILFGAALCVFASCNKNANVSTNDTDASFIPLSAPTQKKIMLDLVNAVDSFAMAMPIIGGDTESSWAADTVHDMAQQVRESEMSYVDNLAQVYLMYDYIAYGFSYFNAILGVVGSDADMAKYALWEMLGASDSLYQALITKEQKTVEELAKFAFVSTFNMQLFNTLSAANNDTSYIDPDLPFTLYCVEAMDSLKKSAEFNENDMFKIYCFLESSAFFKMIFPLLRLFEGQSELAKENNSFILEAASFFDERTDPVFKGEKISLPDDKEFEEYMIKATNYKIKLLRITTREMLLLKE